MKSLQTLFEDAEYFCIKLCFLLSAMSFTDGQLKDCIHSVIVSRDLTQNILLKQLPTAKSKEFMWAFPGVFQIFQVSKNQWRSNQGFRQFSEPRLESLEAPESGAKKFYDRRGHLSSWEHKKHQNPWRWRLTPLSRPGSRPSGPKATPPLSALRASSFSPWGPAEGIEGPQVTVEPGPLRASLRHWCEPCKRNYVLDPVRRAGWAVVCWVDSSQWRWRSCVYRCPQSRARRRDAAVCLSQATTHRTYIAGTFHIDWQPLWGFIPTYWRHGCFTLHYIT